MGTKSHLSHISSNMTVLISAYNTNANDDFFVICLKAYNVLM